MITRYLLSRADHFDMMTIFLIGTAGLCLIYGVDMVAKKLKKK